MKTWGSGRIAPRIFTSALDWDEWSASLPGHFTPLERAPRSRTLELIWTMWSKEKTNLKYFPYNDRLCGLVVRILATDPEARVRFPALPEKKVVRSGTGSTQPREYNW
jgi:hypothetical protein